MRKMYVLVVSLDGLGKVHFLNAILLYADERDWMATLEKGIWSFFDYIH